MLNAFLLLPIFFSSSMSLAAAPELAVDFYRQITSPFPSGQTHQKNLEKNKLRESFEFSYLTSQNKRQIWVEAKDLTRDIQLSKKVVHTVSKQSFTVFDSNAYWLFVENDLTHQRSWQPLTDFSPVTEDSGVALNLTATAIRENPNWKSQVIITLPATSRIEILSIDDTWAFVKFQSGGSITGYVDINNLILKHDFASFVMNSQNKWVAVKYREGDVMIGNDNQRISLAEIKGLQTRPDLGIVSRSNDQKKLLLRQHLTILKTEADVWNVSRLSGHGEVFWKKKTNSIISAEPIKGITNDQILEREIFSVSFAAKDSNFGIISAGGIFLTTDGKNWTQLKQFQNQNHPVLITAEGDLLVGSMRSQNKGKSFESFIKWEAVARLIEEQTKAPPKQLKISSLDLSSANVLKVQVDTGHKKMILASRLTQNSENKWELY